MVDTATLFSRQYSNYISIERLQSGHCTVERRTFTEGKGVCKITMFWTGFIVYRAFEASCICCGSISRRNPTEVEYYVKKDVNTYTYIYIYVCVCNSMYMYMFGNRRVLRPGSAVGAAPASPRTFAEAVSSGEGSHRSCSEMCTHCRWWFQVLSCSSDRRPKP